jgi:hypothetical protein
MESSTRYRRTIAPAADSLVAAGPFRISPSSRVTDPDGLARELVVSPMEWILHCQFVGFHARIRMTTV